MWDLTPSFAKGVHEVGMPMEGLGLIGRGAYGQVY